MRKQNKTEGSNLGAMPEIPKQNEGIESGHNTREPDKKGSYRIWAQCQRTRIKIMGSNLGSISKNLKQKGSIESVRKSREPE